METGEDNVDGGTASSAVVRPEILELAVRNGWPAALFSDVIGRIDDDFHRQPQPPHEDQPAL
jgi:hypothetical protein